MKPYTILSLMLLSLLVLLIIIGIKKRNELSISNSSELDTSSKINSTQYNIPNLETIIKAKSKKVDTVGDIIIYFNDFKLANQFTFDRYNDYEHYRKAERGNKFIICDLKIKAKTKNPNFPCIMLYSVKDSTIRWEEAFNYKFYSWSDYGSYLGNYNDSKNDFVYTESIKFSIGLEINDSDLKAKTYLILAAKNTTVDKKYDRLREPNFYYSCTTCDPLMFGLITDGQLKNDFDLIGIIRKGHFN